ncbi:hypothetical protein [Trujillonella endophytica]|uniref:Mce-associated membrane protein n=1 Tax=Trujillonella endophytica TaxID=673521 RepID=A0A1H8RKR5_9ACTN|nr:hypothetical protein [Trujillella endophytica]SEO67149.1 hypothetical protein SAMN05660991_01186 [Trujillella endophytica]
MSDGPDERPRPTPRPRASAAPRPSPRPRVAGSRRERDEATAGEGTRPARPSPRPRSTAGAEPPATPIEKARPGRGSRSDREPRRARDHRAARARGRVPVVAVLSVLCVLAAGAAALLWWRGPDRTHVDPDLFTAAQENVEAVYRYDYRDSAGSVAGQLDVLTGDLRSRYEAEAEGALIDTYEQVSATIRYDVRDVAVQQVDDDQQEATLVVFGQLVAKSVNSGTQPAPEGSECVVTPEGEQSCVRTVQIRMVRADDEWRISELTVLTTG